MERSRLLPLLACVIAPLLLSGCIHLETIQYPHFPDQTKRIEDPARARVYLIRPQQAGAQGVKILFYGSTPVAAGPRVAPLYGKPSLTGPAAQRRLVGEIGPGAYLCWEEDPQEFTFTRLEGDPKSQCTLNLEAGKVYYLRGSIHSGLLRSWITIDPISEEEGLALLTKCVPPDDYLKRK